MSELTEQVSALRVTWAGRFLYAFLPYRRRVIRSNIDQVYGDQLTPDLKRHLMQAYYSHMATSVKEMIHMRFLTEDQLRSRVDVKGYQQLLDVAAQGRGVLVLTGHFGNWEFAPIGGILNFKQFQGQFYFIRRLLGNKTLERILFRRYFQAGLNVIPKKNSLQQVCEVLEQNNAAVFVLDQHASLKNRDGIAVEFFGKKAGTYRSLASISRHTGIPVIPAAGYRTPDGRHVLEFFEPIPWTDYATTQASLYYNTLAYNQALERIILAHPEQWMWVHQRWKLKKKHLDALPQVL